MTAEFRTTSAMHLASLANGFPARQHVGDGALADVEAEHTLQHFRHAVVADELLCMQIDDQGGDAGAERTAGRHVERRRGRDDFAATRTDAAVQVDARVMPEACFQHDRLDRRQIDEVVGVDFWLAGRFGRTFHCL